jgi:hypothetical protein
MNGHAVAAVGLPAAPPCGRRRPILCSSWCWSLAALATCRGGSVHTALAETEDGPAASDRRQPDRPWPGRAAAAAAANETGDHDMTVLDSYLADLRRYADECERAADPDARRRARRKFDTVVVLAAQSFGFWGDEASGFPAGLALSGGRLSFRMVGDTVGAEPVTQPEQNHE